MTAQVLRLFNQRGEQTFERQVEPEVASAMLTLELDSGPVVDMKQAEDGRGEYVAVRFADGTAAIVSYID